RVWRLLVSPAIQYLMRTYVLAAGTPLAASLTVCQPIADRYHRELGLRPVVVFNAPKPFDGVRAAEIHDPACIRLIHHGYAKRGRGLSHLIEALAHADSRYHLDFMLVDDDRGYIDELRRLGGRLAPGRVHFRAPVAPSDIVRSLGSYDMGFCVIEPSSYNNLMMLPNKLFEYVQARLALCVGPSPAMAALVRGYGLGAVAPTFDPNDVSETLNRLTTAEIAEMKKASSRAA